MNKLQQILDEFDNLPICFNYGEHAAMRNFLSEKLIQYAKSVTYNVRLEADRHQVTTRKILDHIDQDLTSLNEK